MKDKLNNMLGQQSHCIEKDTNLSMDEKTFLAVLPLLSRMVGFAPCCKRSSIMSVLLSADAANRGVLFSV